MTDIIENEIAEFSPPEEIMVGISSSAAEASSYIEPSTTTSDISLNESNYSITYNGFTEIGGIVEVQCSQSQSGHMEGSARVSYPAFTTLLDYQCTALDNNTGALFEHAHLGNVQNDKMTVYASVLGNEHKTVRVKWSAKGIKL